MIDKTFRRISANFLERYNTTSRDQKILLHRGLSARTTKYCYEICNNLKLKYNDEPKVLDVGCGTNEYKNIFSDLLGIDACNINADIKRPFLEVELEDESFDIVLALGSLHYISKEYVFENFDKVIKVLKPDGYILLRSRDAANVEDPDFHYTWSDDMVDEVVDKYNLAIESFQVFNDRGGIPIKRVWLFKKGI
jgi:SAM-dependent methyltransferase